MNIWLGILAIAIIIVLYALIYRHFANAGLNPDGTYKVVDFSTPNFSRGKTNEVRGIILHHTACKLGQAISGFKNPAKEISAHDIIDRNGTIYKFAEPTVVTWHAGFSRLNGRDGCNFFTVGIEFQGNTCKKPLTEHQIKSAIQYIVPLVRKYNIPISNIVTHKKIRDAYIEEHPDTTCPTKQDITDAEYKRFMQCLKNEISIVI